MSGVMYVIMLLVTVNVSTPRWHECDILACMCAVMNSRRMLTYALHGEVTYDTSTINGRRGVYH